VKELSKPVAIAIAVFFWIVVGCVYLYLSLFLSFDIGWLEMEFLIGTVMFAGLVVWLVIEGIRKKTKRKH
jgi:hypothetical protein